MGDTCPNTDGIFLFHSNYQTSTMVKQNGKEILLFTFYLYQFWKILPFHCSLIINPKLFNESRFLLLTLYSFINLVFNVFLSFQVKLWFMDMIQALLFFLRI